MKISKILGVGLSLVLLLSLTLMTAPVSAKTLAYGTETIPSGTGNAIAGGVTILDLAVAPNGTTMYAATGPSGARLYKSTNGGETWSAVTAAAAMAINKVAIAPDSADGSVFAMIDGAKTVRVSTNGGSTIPHDLAYVGVAASVLNALAISPTISGARMVAVGGNDGAGAAELAYFNLGSLLGGWTDAIAWLAGGWTASASVDALAFSPNYVADRTMVAVTAIAPAALNDIKLQTANFATKAWNLNGGYSAAVSVNAAVLQAPLKAADVSLPDTYLGGDDTERISYVALAGVGAGTGGLYRIKDTSVKRLSGAVAVRSVAYNSTSSILLAGAYDNNVVWRCADPLVSEPTVSSSPTYKRPGCYSAVGDTTQVVVDWSGATAVSGSRGLQSAFSCQPMMASHGMISASLILYSPPLTMLLSPLTALRFS